MSKIAVRPLVLVVNDVPREQKLFKRWLEVEGFEVECFADGRTLISNLGRLLPDALCLNLHLPDQEGLDLLADLRARHPRLPIVMLTRDPEMQSVVRAMQLGAHDYLVRPIERPKLVTLMRNAVEWSRMSTRIAQLEREAKDEAPHGMIGRSAAIRDLLRQVDRVGPCDLTVLLSGENGTGKGLLARVIHEQSARERGPFVAANCAAIPESLQESELFGHEHGAFAGADEQRIGCFEKADGGTIFLENVSELTLPLQAKLLRVLQERSFRRLGGSRVLESDFRLLAATSRPLEEVVRRGDFRQDLFFRLAVFELEVPPLRERAMDIIPLAHGFLQQALERTPGTVSSHVRRGSSGLSSEAEDALRTYSWPGNVRELRNAIRRACLVATEESIRLTDLPPRVQPRRGNDFSAEIEAPPSLNGSAAMVNTDLAPQPVAEEEPPQWNGSKILPLQEMERMLIHRALTLTSRNLSETARQLGIGRTTLYRKIKKYGLS